MTSKKIHFYSLSFSVVICIFLYCDTYVIPIKTSKEKIIDKYNFIKSTRRSREHIYQIKTNTKIYEVTQSLHDYADTSDMVYINRSFVTNAIQTISVHNKENSEKFPVGFVNSKTGRIFTSLIMCIAVGFIFLYDRVKTSSGKETFTFIILIYSLCLLAYYLHVYAE